MFVPDTVPPKMFMFIGFSLARMFGEKCKRVFLKPADLDPAKNAVVLFCPVNTIRDENIT